jgi:hypothetical protein
MAAKPFENRTNLSSFRMVKISLDRFINKKWSRLANQFFSHLVFAIQISDHLATGHKSTIQKPETSGFQMLTVQWPLEVESQISLGVKT